MKFRDEYRDGATARRLADAIARTVTRPWTLMEVCGGQTHAIVRFGIDALLPSDITLVHGPGCPVCVTPVEYVDKAIEIAGRADVILCSFGDMLRVPGTDGDLLRRQVARRRRSGGLFAAGRGGDRQGHPARQVVFFAVGFETTAPANAMAAHRAKSQGLRNFSMLVSHVLVPPAMRAVLDSFHDF